MSKFDKKFSMCDDEGNIDYDKPKGKEEMLNEYDTVKDGDNDNNSN